MMSVIYGTVSFDNRTENLVLFFRESLLIPCVFFMTNNHQRRKRTRDLEAQTKKKVYEFTCNNKVSSKTTRKRDSSDL